MGYRSLQINICFVMLLTIVSITLADNPRYDFLTDGRKVKTSNNLILPAPPGADRILFYDFSAGRNNWLTAGAGLTITGTNMVATTSAHEVLDGDIHTNTTDQSIIRGDLIYGFANDNMRRFAIGTGVLHGDGTDVTAWSVVDISATTNLTVSAPVTLTDDDIGFDDAAYSLIDGTRPFTGVVGGIDPTASNHLATKEYIDMRSSSIQNYFLTDDAADIGGIYFVAGELPTGAAEGTLTTAGLGAGDGQALSNFATISTLPGVDSLLSGTYELHIHAEKTAGTKPVIVFFELYTRTAGGAETLRATSEDSGAITSKADFDIHATVPSDVTINTTDRLVWKVLADVGVTGSNATIALYTEGTNNSRVDVPTTTEVLSSVFVRQDGTTELTDNWDAGAFDIRALTGTFDSLTSGRVAVVSTDGLLVDDADFTFATDTLTVTKIAAFELTGKQTAGATEIEGSNFDINGGDINAATISGGLTWSAAQDLNNQNLTNVDIDSGAIDNTVIGAGTAAAATVTTLGSDTITVTANNDVTLSGTGHVTSGSEGFIIGAAAVEEGELEILDGATVTTTELNYLDGTILGTAVASKVLAVGASLELAMGYGDRTDPGAMDGSVSTDEVTGLSEHALWSFEVSLAPEAGGSGSPPTLTKTAGTSRYKNRGTKFYHHFNQSTYYTAAGYKGVVGTGPRTYNYWVKIETADSGKNLGMLANGDFSTGGKYFAARQSAATDFIFLFFGNGNVSSSTALADGVWHMITIVVPAGGSPTYNDIIIYCDAGDDTGVVTNGSNSVDTEDGGAEDDMRIGTEQTATNEMLGGMDEFAVFDKALTPAEITAIYNSQKPKFIGGSDNSQTDWTPGGNAQSDFVTAGSVTGGSVHADNGFSGSWVNNEGETVTVVDGIITGVTAP